MTRIKLAHYRIKRGRGFWEPTKAMRAAGFESIPCGPDGPEAWAVATAWEKRWQATLRGEAPSPVISANLGPDAIEELTAYPRRSLGEAFKRYRRTDEWARKAPRTREEWFRAWRRIKPIFGDVDPRTVTLEHISGWRAAIEGAVSLREAHRSLKIWRALWKVAAALGYCLRDADPSLGVRNAAAAGRNQTWREGEAVRLYKRARRMGFHGLAAIIAVSWPTQLSPGDVRGLRSSQFARADAGAVFFTARGKTGVPIGGLLNARAIAALEAYLATLPELVRARIEKHDELLFQNRSGAPYSKDTLGDDFREVRAAEFGDAERRTLADFRRSGAVEAIAGDATAEQVAHAMGNTLGASNALFATYVPINLSTLSAVREARRKGRIRIR